jgi:uncharacterized protein YjbI with pentapeptide repeats
MGILFFILLAVPSIIASLPDRLLIEPSNLIASFLGLKTWLQVDFASDPLQKLFSTENSINLSNKSLRGIQAPRGHFSSTHRNANLTFGNFHGSDFRGGELISIFAWKTDFGSCLFSDSVSGSPKLSTVSDANTFHAARFKDCTLQSCIFSHATLYYLVAEDTYFAFTKFNAVFCGGSLFRNCELMHTSFDHADCQRVTFNSEKMWGINFSDANLSFTKFVNCDLAHGDFSRADLQGSTFDHCFFTAAKFIACRMENTSFRDCDFSGADLAEREPRTVGSLEFEGARRESAS